jgi:hypothetical protein
MKKNTVLNIVIDNPVITEVSRELEKFLSLLSPDGERIKIVHKGKDKKRRNKNLNHKGGI